MIEKIYCTFQIMHEFLSMGYFFVKMVMRVVSDKTHFCLKVKNDQRC